MLYLIRHADAVGEDVDPARPLSARGLAQARQVAEFLAKSGAFSVQAYWHSPLVRARQTAEIFAQVLGPAAALVETAGLLSEDDPRGVRRRIEHFARTGSLAVVGHEPHLGFLASLLLTGAAQPARVHFRKCAVFCLSRADESAPAAEASDWILEWSLFPGLLPQDGSSAAAGQRSQSR